MINFNKSRERLTLDPQLTLSLGISRNTLSLSTCLATRFPSGAIPLLTDQGSPVEGVYGELGVPNRFFTLTPVILSYGSYFRSSSSMAPMTDVSRSLNTLSSSFRLCSNRILTYLSAQSFLFSFMTASPYFEMSM
ncbi:hypothetical protein MetMK1DRAFT_00002920 [Metallosphaera yellowstonensis MK1]|uniref:Uncharacterized protein n=1 Tax=Metallosphaera yellowstonensis MK1 TaxID=671065 RepID=H2C4C5_9CREN|nr:hypothetical protein MetMK1DRAFT_00002920 [Metallosphaera yellowstonensis MK1]